MKHNNLESGFIKGATEFGVEADCVKGYIKQAEQTYDFCCGVIDQAEKNSKDPGFRQKLAFELLCANMNPEIIKTALEDKRGNELMEMLGKMFSGGGEMFQQGATGLGSALGAGGNSAGGLGGALMGGGGGALTGLLLSKLLGVNPLIGMLLMGSLGGMAGHHFGGNPQNPSNITKNVNDSMLPAQLDKTAPQVGGKPTMMASAPGAAMTPESPLGEVAGTGSGAGVNGSTSPNLMQTMTQPGQSMQAPGAAPTSNNQMVMTNGDATGNMPGIKDAKNVNHMSAQQGTQNMQAKAVRPQGAGPNQSAPNNPRPNSGPVPGAGFDYKPMPTAQV